MIAPNGGWGHAESTKAGEYPEFALRANSRLNCGVGPSQMTFALMLLAACCALPSNVEIDGSEGLLCFATEVLNPPVHQLGQPVSKSAFIKVLGKPQSSHVQKIHNESWDTDGLAISWKWTGLVVAVSAATNDPECNSCALEGVEVTSERYALPHGLRVGMPVDRFLQAFAPAEPQREKGVLTFSGEAFFREPNGAINGGYVEVTLFTDVKGNVTKVIWGFPIA